MVPEVRARSLPEANLELAEFGGRWAVVSIGEPGGEPPLGFNERNPLHLRLEFHDIVEPLELDGKVFVPPGLDHVRTLVAFAPLARTARVVYCHCVAGISRSTAVAYILRAIWGGPGSEADALIDVYEDRPQAWPNERLVELADEVLGWDGALGIALRAHQS